MSERLNVILDGKITQAYKGETILALCRRNDIAIPTLCDDPRMDPFTSCFVCVVEVEGMKGLQPSCSTKVMEGMKIISRNPRVEKARKTALDLLVSNHYADCIGPCKQTCPAGVDVQGYISLIDKGQYNEAVGIIKETNPLPAICGRVCVRPCEVACRRNLLGEGAPVGIDYLKRFTSDIDLMSETKFRPEIKESTGKKVAVIGAGPGGLSSAFFLQKEGHQVDIYEAAPAAGGWLRYGIPEYRLPNDILQKEVDNITELGVNIYYNKKFGKDITYNDIKQRYDALILAIGSQKGTLIGCEGDDAENVFSGIDFLKEMQLSGKTFDFSGKKVAVVGGGNTAMDCCRTSMRCGADKVYVIYRRTENEMPANPIEIHESKLEGVDYLLLTNPVKVNKDHEGKVESVTCIKMELGEPDASGRRRPMPIEGSEFTLEVDFILAAIGQKTQADFVELVNKDANGSELKLNRWGDIDAKPDTLQTGIPSVFACGDGVTGPATLIQAIGQARIASHSCNLYLHGEKVKPIPTEFLSKKDNFREQNPSEYKGHFPEQKREEMPTLAAEDRFNFNEVELGYADEAVAKHEAQRCLECGCTALYTCDLKKHSTEYGAVQEGVEGEFKEYQVDFRHPYVEIDNNKCILCSRCIRICREVVGANALGLVNRGFNSWVAPAMGERLQDTTCESCGLCISTCPTGAITENFWFKPGPIKGLNVNTICNYCSVGCEITLNHSKGFVHRVEGSKGRINKDGNLCQYAKFGYRYINDPERLTKPLLKRNGDFEEISFEDAYKIIAREIKKVNADGNAFFAGARLTNEEMYLVQKLARKGAKTNNIANFHYLNRGKGYALNSKSNMPFEQMKGASKIYLIGSEINQDNPVVGYMISNTRFKKNIPAELVTNRVSSSMEHKVDEVLHVKSYYYFIKAVNYYLLANNFHNAMFIRDNCQGFEEYKEQLLEENFVDLVDKSGIPYMDQVIEFAKRYNNEMNAIVVFSEKEISGNASDELFNLAMLTGKIGKTSSGLICLKEKNNSQGLFDMGIDPAHLVGLRSINDPEVLQKLQETWGADELPANYNEDTWGLLQEGKLKNLFIFGEDPMGTAMNKENVAQWLSDADFVMVQDYFMTDTAKQADLILPASLPFESGGSYSNTLRIIQEFDAVIDPKVKDVNHKQLVKLLKELGSSENEDLIEIRMEALSLLDGKNEKVTYQFEYTQKDDGNRMFASGADTIHARFDKEFLEALSDTEQVKQNALKVKSEE